MPCFDSKCIQWCAEVESGWKRAGLLAESDACEVWSVNRVVSFDLRSWETFVFETSTQTQSSGNKEEEAKDTTRHQNDQINDLIQHNNDKPAGNIKYIIMMVDPPPEGVPPQAATDRIYSSLGLEEGRTNRFGIHVVEDAEVVAAADDNGNKDGEELVDDHSSEEAAVVIEGTLINSRNCFGKEVETNTVKWSLCALLLIIVAIVVPIAIIKIPSTNISNTDDAIESNKTTKIQKKFLQLVSRLSSREDLQNPSSPQSKAAEWLLTKSLPPLIGNTDEDPKNITMDFLNISFDDYFSERYIAATIYYGLGGEEWTTQDNWLSGLNPSDAYNKLGPIGKWSKNMVQVNENGIVIGLFLGDNNLRGQIPPEIQHLSQLKYLHVENNPFINGTVPKEMERLSNLEGFWALNTSLTGDIDFLCNESTANNSNFAADCENCGFLVELNSVNCMCCR